MKERLQAISDFAPEVKTYLKNGAVVRQTSVFQDSKVTPCFVTDGKSSTL